MNATVMLVGLLIVLLTILLLHRTHKLKPRIARYGTQTMCPSCGLITSRLKPCLHGVWQVPYKSGVFNGREMNRRFVRYPLALPHEGE